jgi:hypothetical protein
MTSRAVSNVGSIFKGLPLALSVLGLSSTVALARLDHHTPWSVEIDTQQKSARMSTSVQQGGRLSILCLIENDKYAVFIEDETNEDISMVPYVDITSNGFFKRIRPRIQRTQNGTIFLMEIAEYHDLFLNFLRGGYLLVETGGQRKRVSFDREKSPEFAKACANLWWTHLPPDEVGFD